MTLLEPVPKATTGTAFGTGCVSPSQSVVSKPGVKGAYGKVECVVVLHQKYSAHGNINNTCSCVCHNFKFVLLKKQSLICCPFYSHFTFMLFFSFVFVG